MAEYYVNTNSQPNGDHEVHKEGCEHFPDRDNAKYLGSFNNCSDAVSKAKEMGYKSADGCYYCSRACHKS